MGGGAASAAARGGRAWRDGDGIVGDLTGDLGDAREGAREGPS